MSEAQNNDIQKKRGEISEKLKNTFSFKHDDFSEPIQWIDDVGLSRIKKYNNQHASIYKFGIVKDEFNKETTRKKLWVSAGYGKELEGGISYGSATQKISDPIDVDFPDEFSYDLITGKFYHLNNETTAQKILSVVESAHIKPMKLTRGLYLRSRLFFWRKFLPAVIKLLDLLFVKALWLISGEKIEASIMSRLVGSYRDKPKDGIPSKTVKYEESEMIDFFGYKATRWSVVFYCGLHLFLLIIYLRYKLNFQWVKIIFGNSFLVLCYIIVSFEITEALIPLILKSIINKITPKALGTISFRRLRI